MSPKFIEANMEKNKKSKMDFYGEMKLKIRHSKVQFQLQVTSTVKWKSNVTPTEDTRS